MSNDGACVSGEEGPRVVRHEHAVRITRSDGCPKSDHAVWPNSAFLSISLTAPILALRSDSVICCP